MGFVSIWCQVNSTLLHFAITFHFILFYYPWNVCSLWETKQKIQINKINIPLKNLICLRNVVYFEILLSSFAHFSSYRGLTSWGLSLSIHGSWDSSLHVMSTQMYADQIRPRESCLLGLPCQQENISRWCFLTAVPRVIPSLVVILPSQPNYLILHVVML